MRAVKFAQRASEVHGVSEVVLRTVKFCSITRKVSLKRGHPERSVSGVEPVRAMLCIGILPFAVFFTLCAHYGRLYNAKLSKRPTIYKEYSEMGIMNNRLFAILLCMKHMLKKDKHWNLFVDKIGILIDKYEEIDIKTMGFPEEWKNLLEVK